MYSKTILFLNFFWKYRIRLIWHPLCIPLCGNFTLRENLVCIFLYLRNTWNFKIRFWNFNQSFYRNNLPPLNINFETFAQAQVLITYYLLHLFANFLSWGQKKNSRNWLGETFLSLTRPHSRMCIRIYIFNFKKKKKKKKQEKKTTQKKLKKKREYLWKI